jgi:hypothetical protein
MPTWEEAAAGLVDVQMAHFGNGVLQYRSPTRPADAEPYEFPCILGVEAFAPVHDSVMGTFAVRISRTADVPTALLLAKNINEFEPHARFSAGGYDDWTLDEAESNWDEAFVTFGLVREPLVNGNELRRAAV